MQRACGEAVLTSGLRSWWGRMDFEPRNASIHPVDARVARTPTQMTNCLSLTARKGM